MAITDVQFGTETAHLEKMKAIMLKRIAESDIRMAIARVDIDIDEYAAFTADEMLIRLKAEVLGEHIETPAARYPKDWKEAVKARFFPKWALMRWPVRYTVKVFDARVVYPMITLPRKQHYISAVDLKEIEATGVVG